MLSKSKHNIVSKIADSNEYFIVNLLSGNADVLTAEEYQNYVNNSFDAEMYSAKGYLVDEAEEKKAYKNKYLDFIDARDSDEIQLFFVPTYACNFNCSYCYQSGYETNPSYTVDNELVDSFFNYINLEFEGRKKYITLFGGEPLLGGTSSKKFLQYFINKCNESKLDLAIVSNGFLLKDYIPILKEASIREIQITLDGPKEIHNKRRPVKSGADSFDVISEGIDLALQNQLPINLRAVVDKENIDSLPELAEYAIDKGWTKSPYFKTQLGRNYELHYCQSEQGKLYSRLSMYQDIYKLIKQNPNFIEFHKPAYSIAKFLFENGELPDPLFDACPGAKTEWAFDYTGTIYSCTATVGKKGESLGTFFPEVSKHEDLIEEWQERDVLSIDKCKTCSLQLACGGGCGSMAKNYNGSLHSEDCRPVKELLELGIGLYSTLKS
jgi:uncharacterized protein